MTCFISTNNRGEMSADNLKLQAMKLTRPVADPDGGEVLVPGI